MSRPDDVRRQHRELTPTERAAVDSVKDAGQRLVDVCDMLGDSRELRIARTRAEEAVMWAVKHVTAPPGR